MAIERLSDEIHRDDKFTALSHGFIIIVEKFHLSSNSECLERRTIFITKHLYIANVNLLTQRRFYELNHSSKKPQRQNGFYANIFNAIKSVFCRHCTNTKRFTRYWWQRRRTFKKRCKYEMLMLVLFLCFLCFGFC